MRRATPQGSFRFSVDADPRFCANAFCRVKRLKKPTHALTVGKLTFLLCASCARPYEGMHGARVDKIAEAANG